jgi:hypothetical protein
MAPKSKRETSELLDAAAELDAALRRFGERTEQLRVAPLDSQKNLKRASVLFQELGEIEPQMAARVQAMAAILMQTRSVQEKWVETIKASAANYQMRANVLEELLVGYRTLGEGVGTLNNSLRNIPADAPAEMRAETVRAAVAGMESLAEAAQTLGARCAAESFADVGREVDALRQQLVHATKQLLKVA